MKDHTYPVDYPIWHPFTQGLTDKAPVHIEKAKGALLYGTEAREYIDGVSSWWVNLHGHCHPVIARAITEQAQKLDQVIFAGFTHTGAMEFARELLEFLPGDMSKIFFSDNGSTSIEVGIKMALQYWYNLGEKKQTIVALEHSYHGDTFGSMSVSQRGAFNRPFSDLLFDVEFISSPGDLNQVDKAKEPDQVLREFQKIAETGKVAAFIYEPLVQGAGGMLMYEPGVLDGLLELCRTHGIIAIADEVMTGFGRTGKFFAGQYLKHNPDIICLSKGITGGVLPMGATATNMRIYDAFLSGDRTKTFFHGHSYTGNALSIAAARASLGLLKNSMPQIQNIEKRHKDFLPTLGALKNVQRARSRGTILAFDVVSNQETSYFNSLRDRLYDGFLNRGVLLRPLGNVVYVMPPYCIEPAQLGKIYEAIIEVVSGL